MRANVSELLRNFPRIRRAALSGERVVIQTREGNLVITAERSEHKSLFGALAKSTSSKALRAKDSGADESDWNSSL